MENKEESTTKKIMPLIIIFCVIVCLLIFSVIFALININNEKIIGKVSIMGIDVSNMTMEEATTTITDIVNAKLSEEMILKKDDYETSLNGTQINANFDIENAVGTAYNIGRNGNIVTNNYSIIWSIIWGTNIEMNLNYNEETLNKKINDISSKLPGAVVQSSYYIEDEELIIVKGKSGIEAKKDELKNTIIQSIKEITKKYDIITIPTEEVEPEEIDLEKIRNEIYKEPEDAYVSKNPTTVHTHVNGVDFKVSMEEAEQIIAEEKDEYIIPLKITLPEKTLEDLGEEAFPDELASYTTRYDPSNKNRGNNITISAEKIDGTIVMPGEVFSYNQTVGERTIAAGYKEAPIYVNGEVVDGLGGGICQITSTLYNAVVYANLEIVERSNHQFVPSYVKASRDATVVYGSIDFKFKNNRNYPIKITCSVSNGIAKFDIYGLKTDDDYEVEISSRITSQTSTSTNSEAYKILKKNGQVVSTTLLSRDTYKRH